MSETEPRRVPTGEAYAKARRRVGYTVEVAAERLGIPVRALGDYESGLRTPPADVMAAMSDLYGVERGRLGTWPWVERVPPRYDEATQTLWMDWISVRLERGNNEQVARAVAAAIRTLRSLPDLAPIVIRSAEIPILGELFDLEDEALPDVLMRYLQLPPSDALALVNTMVAAVAVKS